MRIFAHIILAFCLLFPVSAIAQNQDDATRLESYLQDLLSGAGRDIQIRGLKGVLNSKATLESLTIADDAGIWLELQNATLNWDRKALLGGALQVKELSAQEIILTRWPSSNVSSLPSPEASEFALPKLPVSINIDRLSAQRLVLGALVLGEAATLELSGAASLTDGTGHADLTLHRLDGKRGAFSLTAEYSNSTGQLDLALNLSEDKGGLFANLVQLPDRAAVDLDLTGAGTMQNFHADLTLATDGQQRLTGAVTIQPGPMDATAPNDSFRQFDLTVSGDLAPVFSPRFAAFFDGRSYLNAQAQLFADGRIAVSNLDLATASMALTGRVGLDASRWPTLIDLTGRLEQPDGGAVILPVPKSDVQLARADLRVTFDAAMENAWHAEVSAQDVLVNGSKARTLDLTGTGQIQSGLGDGPGQADGALDVRVQRLVPQNPNLAQALGQDLAGHLDFAYQEGAPLRVSNLTLSGRDLTLGGNIDLQRAETGFDFLAQGALSVQAQDLSRLSGLTGVPLGGQARVKTTGQIALLSGIFDLAVDGVTQDLAFGQDWIDPVLKGAGTITFAAQRDTQGTRLEGLRIQTDQGQVSASGSLSSGESQFAAQAVLNDGQTLFPGLTGRLTAEVSARRQTGDWQVAAKASGAKQALAELSGTLGQDLRTADIALTGRLPLELANVALAPRLVSGSADFDMRLVGPLKLGSLRGEIRTQDATVTLPTLQLGLSAMNVQAKLSDGWADLSATARPSTDGRLTASGRIGLDPFGAVQLEIVLDQVGVTDHRTIYTTASGPLRLTGASLSDIVIAGDLTLDKTEVRLPETDLPGLADVSGLQHISEPPAVQANRKRAGLVAAGPGGQSFPIDLTVTATNGIFLRGRGLDAELGGQVRLQGTTSNVQPQGDFSLIRGRLDFLGRRFNFTEGTATLGGSFDPRLHLVAATQSDATTIRIIVDGLASAPDIKIESSDGLPEDEVLSRLIFGKGLSSISPLQAARLAASAATLFGGGGGLIDTLRTRFGLDDLDITTTTDGQTQARLGRYINENIYTDVTVSSSGKTVLNLNLSLSPTVTARGSLDSTGETSQGLFFEKDY